jgi:hypothetical protein
LVLVIFERRRRPLRSKISGQGMDDRRKARHGKLAKAGFQVEIALAESTWLRSKNFWILPVDVFGMTPNTTAFGVLKPDM